MTERRLDDTRQEARRLAGELYFETTCCSCIASWVGQSDERLEAVRSVLLSQETNSARREALEALVPGLANATWGGVLR